ncbi:MAG: hypothetical protein PHU43_11060 [Candidatus Bipolaricaulis sp.]|nr:hypothetical protein [Candidatus Bipolaricaulis sp.]
MSGLFHKEHPGVAIGDTFINLEIEGAGIPDPMMKVRVAEVDEVGMIHLASISSPARRVIVSEKSLGEKYRRA